MPVLGSFAEPKLVQNPSPEFTLAPAAASTLQHLFVTEKLNIFLVYVLLLLRTGAGAKTSWLLWDSPAE